MSATMKNVRIGLEVNGCHGQAYSLARVFAGLQRAPRASEYACPWHPTEFRNGFLAIVVTASFLPLLCALPGCNRGGKDDDDAKPVASATRPATQPADADEGEKVKLTAAAVERYGIRVGKANKHALLPTVVAPARIAFNGDAYARVGSAVAGRVVELKAKLGDMVQKGDELLVVESTELGEAQSDLLQKRMALSAATIAVEPARISYERAKGALRAESGTLAGGSAETRGRL